MMEIQRLGAFLRFKGALAGNLREIAILVTARAYTAQFEWWAHRRIAENQENIAPEICDAIAVGEKPKNLTPEESTGVRFFGGTSQRSNSER
eukprot:TRINITY_DN5610_c0_g1_i1.p1 TRINITY_DN5610_c0_g1~~TRINITY_DN5610_c0_g1_i1.p1  ORF type:complete len:92 (-),score=17.29 TRINITY_DN5610_c0_g1_i1:202-477(-)